MYCEGRAEQLRAMPRRNLIAIFNELPKELFRVNDGASVNLCV